VPTLADWSGRLLRWPLRRVSLALKPKRAEEG